MAIESEFNKEFIDISCIKCGTYGYVFNDSFDTNLSAICPACNAVNGLIMCSNCGTGSHLEIDLSGNPDTYNCPQCDAKQYFGEGFYTNAKKLYRESSLPASFRKILDEGLRTTKRNRIIMLFVIATVALLIAFFFINNA